MSIFRKKKNAGNSFLTKYYNNKLTTNNFSLDVQLRNFSFRNQTPLNHSELNYDSGMTCCSLGMEDCNYYSNFCIWDMYSQFCSAHGVNARSCSHNDEFCCGDQIPNLNNQNNNSGDNLQTRSLSNQITPDEVDPGDGSEYARSNWWKETSNWVLRGNRNLNNNFEPVPCALPPVYSFSTGQYSCDRYLEKVLNDGNPLITMADWNAILCEERPEPYSQIRENFDPGDDAGGWSGSCPAPGDLNGDGGRNILDVVLYIDWIILMGLGAPANTQTEWFENYIEHLYNWNGIYIAPECQSNYNLGGGAGINIIDLILLVEMVLNFQFNTLNPYMMSMLNNFQDDLLDIIDYFDDGQFHLSTEVIEYARPIIEPYRLNFKQYIAQQNMMDWISPE